MFDIVILGIIVISVLVAFIQARRGGMRSLVSLGLALFLAILAFVIAQPVANGIMSADITSFGLDLPNGETASSLNAYIVGMITGSSKEAGDIVNSSPALISLIEQIPVAVVSVILFVLLYFILRPIKWILYLVICRFVAPKRDADGNKIKTNYWAGFGICCARMLVTLSVLLVLVVGVFGLLSSVSDIMENLETEVADNNINEDTVTVYDIVDDYESSVTYTVISAVRLDSAYQAAFNGLSTIKLEDGSKTTLFGEVTKLMPTVQEVLKLSEIDSENLTSDDLGIISEMIKNIGKSDLVGEVLSSVIKDTADAVLNKNEERFGIKLDEMDPATKDLVSDLLGSFAESSTEDVKEDIVVLGGCIDVLKDAGIIEAVVGSGEDMDINKVLDCITGKTEDGQDNPLIEKLFEELNKSDRLSKLTGSLTNFGLYQGNAALGIPYDKTEVHSNMVSNVGEALNNSNVSAIDMDKVYKEIVRQAEPQTAALEIGLRFSSPIIARRIARVTAVDDGKDDYQRFMDALVSIIAAVDNAGIKYEGDGTTITYTVFSTTYQYNTETESWELASGEVEPTVVAVLAQKIIETAKETDTVEFTDDNVTEVLSTVANDSDVANVPEVKQVADQLADETKFETENVTFKDNIAIDTSAYSKEDSKELASVVTDLVNLAQKVIEAIPEGDGEESGDVLSSLLDGDTLKEVGAVLDKLNNMDATPDNFSSNILQGVVDQMGDDEASKPIKDTLNSVIDGVKDPDKDVNYEDILGGVGDTSTGILSLLDYVQAKQNGENPDKNAVIEKLAKSFESIAEMKLDALNLLKDSLLDNIKDMMPENSKDVSVLLTSLIDKIADFDSVEGHDYKTDASAVIDLYEYLTGERKDTTSDDIVNDIINILKNSDILAFVSTDILHDFAAALLEHGGEASYLGMVIHKADIFTADYIASGTAKSMGDKFVTELFTVMKSDAFVQAPKDNLNIVADILDVFVSANGRSLADCIMNAKKSGVKLPNVAGTAFAGLEAIYGK